MFLHIRVRGNWYGYCFWWRYIPGLNEKTGKLVRDNLSLKYYCRDHICSLSLSNEFIACFCLIETKRMKIRIIYHAFFFKLSFFKINYISHEEKFIQKNFSFHRVHVVKLLFLISIFWLQVSWVASESLQFSLRKFVKSIDLKILFQNILGFCNILNALKIVFLLFDKWVKYLSSNQYFFYKPDFKGNYELLLEFLVKVLIFEKVTLRKVLK